LFSNDIKELDLLISEEYIGFDPHGNPQDKAMSLEAYSPGAASLDKYEAEEIETRIIGEVGIIMGKGYIHGTYAGCEFEHSVRFIDMYVLRSGAWRLYLSQLTPLGAV
jgi:hypothetical protein